jgi:glycerol-3-phosphate acyltransferase PlsY
MGLALDGVECQRSGAPEHIATPGRSYAAAVDPWWALVVPAYFLGTFPTALLVGRREGRDPTKEGSGNPGASNALRTMGRRAGALVLLGDLGKGVVATGTGWALGGRGVGVACGVAAVLGHVAPATRGFRGGKGVATAAGMALVLLPVPALLLGLLWAGVVKVTGAAAAGSIAVAVGFPVAAGIVGRPAGEVAALTLCSVLVVIRHRDNLERLRRGEEAPLRAPVPPGPA